VAQLDVAVAQRDRQATGQEVVGVIVLVPDELPANLDDRQLIIVEVANDSRAN
jgi:hypothetical protein